MPEDLITEAEQSQLGFRLYFLLLHFLSAISFYVLGYDSMGMYKPAWTKQLR